MKILVCLQKAWKEILLFFVVSVIYFVCVTPDVTWVFLDCDLWDFMFATKFATISHFPGFPVYIMWGILIQSFFAEGSAWGLSLFGSTIPAIMTVIMIFYITKKLTDNEWSPYIAALGLAGASTYFSQTIIPEVYSFSIFMMIFTWFLLVYEKYTMGAIVAGLACGTHVFVIPAILAMLFYYSCFRNKWYWFILFSVLPYLYILVSARSEWMYGAEEFFITYVWETIYDNFGYWGAIAIWDFPQRLFETAVLLSTSFGLALIPMFYYFKNWRKAGFIIACILIPVFYYIGCNVESSYVHFSIAFPFLAVAAGLGLNKFKLHPSAILAVSGFLLLIFPLSFDIGNTLDEEMSAQDMYHQIEQISDGSVVFGYCENQSGKQTGGGREGIMYYNRIRGKNIIALNTGWIIKVDELGNKTVFDCNSKDSLESFGLIAPELVSFRVNDDEITDEERQSFILDSMRRIKEANSSRKFYIMKTISDDTGDKYNFGRRLVEW